ncbi:3-oxoacyl-ACP reductase FabG [Rhodococcus opacus]|uniref:3-oxoacyl-[acyl-carrier-protein] reductase MabA n=1 Tax=Rhodococcus opacus TaxID=37919 RepID=A0AAX3Y8R0_RHOOP|nr:3-oxoacyl-ACP reductase FabG [Rhodococcus opacus]MCZ4583072.1 3-oxoacyl-ACP reductase FabG [Rhodococcus opacus]WKN54282.1 3-oxoacyl-ACP reductase FabG [Rhodococcus opacus]WLF45725.1 3-oxoacyl-ACP reductase FabG [Rhodococcus opacus]
MDLELTGKVAIVTGSARGLGEATARRLAAEGAHVVVTDIDGEAAALTAKDIVAQGHSAHSIRGDITKSTDVDALVVETVDRFGGIHILVNNAGFPRDGVLTKMSESDWDDVVDVILKGVYFTCKSVLPYLIEQRWGRIVNISSRAQFGNPGQANYASAKAGLLGLTRALALEEGRFGITVNAVAPGFVATEAVRSLGHFEKIKDKAIESTPLRRVGTPEDIADAVAFLASERASFVSGETLHVTGGRFG